VKHHVDTSGQAPALCSLTVPDAADARFRAAPTSCSEQCREQGKSQLTASRPRREAPANDSGGDRVRCCDGTLSPSCTYSRSSLRGCCSHHGGVC
jgi:hypothetical protein